VGVWSGWAYVLWIPLVGLVSAIGLILAVKYLGEPGDLNFTTKTVYRKGYLGIDYLMPGFIASQFSIVGGASVGPVAPLLTICGSLGGFVSRSIFKTKDENIIRKHTLMGMCGALAAFFGSPLGGSLFAIEINHHWEYFQHAYEAIFCGEITMVVFRACAGLPIEPIWHMLSIKLDSTTPTFVAIGAALGLFGAMMALIFTKFHFKVMEIFEYLNILDNEKVVWRSLLAAFVWIPIGMFVPHVSCFDILCQR